MLRNLGFILFSLCTLVLASCKVTIKATDTPIGDFEIEMDLDEDSGERADKEAKPWGKGTATGRDGNEIEGELFDTDGDGMPDKFKPTRGQSGDGAKGETNGTDWYDITPV